MSTSILSPLNSEEGGPGETVNSELAFPIVPHPEHLPVAAPTFNVSLLPSSPAAAHFQLLPVPRGALCAFGGWAGGLWLLLLLLFLSRSESSRDAASSQRNQM